MSVPPNSNSKLHEAINSPTQDPLTGVWSFTPNTAIGRLKVCKVAMPVEMLTKRKGICSEWYERAKNSWETEHNWLTRQILSNGRAAGSEETDEMNSAKSFQRKCEKMPDAIPKSVLNEKQQQLSDHYSGKTPLPPEQSLELRSQVHFLQDIYQPGPRFENGLSNDEQAWLNEKNLRLGNSLSIAILGPIFGAPGAITRMAGGSEQAVGAANQFGAAAFDVAAAHVGFGGKRAAEPLSRSVERVNGAPLEPVSRSGAKQSSPRNPGGQAAEPVRADGVVVAKKAPLRAEYEAKVRALKDKETQLRNSGKSEEEIARELHANRRALGVEYKDLTPKEMLDKIYERNLTKYGDKLGPTIEWLQERGKSWSQIIESATRTGGKDLGL